MERTHLIGIPHLMPGTIIFVHGVNSEGEWYADASRQFAEGLKTRLGREDLEGFLDPTRGAKRFPRGQGGKRPHSPIIPFYWGYCVPPSERQHIIGEDSIPVDKHGNPLRKDGTWGGGPFQNGTNNLLPFWLPTGFRKDILFGIVNLDKVNPVHDGVRGPDTFILNNSPYDFDTQSTDRLTAAYLDNIVHCTRNGKE